MYTNSLALSPEGRSKTLRCPGHQNALIIRLFRTRSQRNLKLIISRYRHNISRHPASPAGGEWATVRVGAKTPSPTHASRNINGLEDDPSREGLSGRGRGQRLRGQPLGALRTKSTRPRLSRFAPCARTTRIETADRFFAATGAEIRHGGTRAYYAEGSDHVQMSPFETFTDTESYAATLGYELIHWMKHPKRLARDMGRVRWGDEGYAREELVMVATTPRLERPTPRTDTLRFLSSC
jgi:Zincin-like metallopeptidase